MNSERIHLTHCDKCGAEIPYGFHCEACVKAHRVCQMCLNDISDRGNAAYTCSVACKESRKRGRRRVERELQGNVPAQTLTMVGELIGRIEALENRQDRQDQAIGALVAVQTETNRQLASLGEKLDFFLDRLSQNWQQGTPATGSTMPSPRQIKGADKPLPPPEELDDLDFDIEVKVDESAGDRAAENLRRSLWALQSMSGQSRERVAGRI